ncbi:MAG: molecular chaperone TorD family protein [Pirellulales bacterium]|nr:molecular chaperone TorD family protein [Pirellulales bacterium]
MIKNPAVAIDSREAELTATAGMYRILSILWWGEVSAELLEALQSGSHAQTFADHHFFSANDTMDVTTLAADYCQLFIGPRGHLPPYQSVWEEGQLAGRATASMRRYLDLLEFPLLQRGLEADHLGCQLALMGAITTGLSVVGTDDQKRTAYEALGREFFALHMRWPAALLAQTRQQAQTPFYGALGRCTADFLEMESAVWSESKSA